MSVCVSAVWRDANLIRQSLLLISCYLNLKGNIERNAWLRRGSQSIPCDSGEDWVGALRTLLDHLAFAHAWSVRDLSKERVLEDWKHFIELLAAKLKAALVAAGSPAHLHPKVVWRTTPSFGYRREAGGAYDSRSNHKIQWVTARQVEYLKLNYQNLRIEVHNTFDITVPLFHMTADTHHYLRVGTGEPEPWPSYPESGDCGGGVGDDRDCPFGKQGNAIGLADFYSFLNTMCANHDHHEKRHSKPAPVQPPSLLERKVLHKLPKPAADAPPLDREAGQNQVLHKTLLAKSSNPPLKKYNDPRYQPKFVMKHLTKAGGTFLRVLLEAVISDNPADGRPRFHYINDDNPLNSVAPGKAPHERDFLAITMRNVCDLYLSFASFGPGKAYAYGINETVGPYSDAQKKLLSGTTMRPADFKTWMLNARRKFSSAGFYSFYFHGHIVTPECYYNDVHKKSFQRPNPKQAELTEACDRSPTRIQEDLRTFDPMYVARCWLFHETLLDDVRQCLQVWEKEAAWVKDAVNWAKFEAIAKNETMQAELLGTKAHEKMAGRTTRSHASCSEMFPPGGELEQLVRETDPWLFEKLGYSGCCTRSNHLTTPPYLRN